MNRRRPSRIRRLGRRWRGRYRKARAAARKAVRTGKRVYRGGRKVARKIATTYRAYLGKPKTHRPVKRRAGQWYRTVPAGTGKPRTRPARPPQTQNRGHQPPRRLVATQAAGWLAVGGVAIALSRDGFNSTWIYDVDLLGGTAAVALAGYHATRRFGWANHGAQQARRQLKNNARMVGCHAACQHSPLPKSSCRCPCGAQFHGRLRRKSNP